MNSMEEALIASGANIAFKTSPPIPEKSKTTLWIACLEARNKLAKQSGSPKGKSKQRVIQRTALDPINKTAALVTSQRPEN